MAALEREKAREPITVPDEITEFHPLVERARKLPRRRKQEDYTVWREQPCLDMRVGPELFDRASRIFHIVLVELAARELRVEVTQPKRGRSAYDFESSRTIVHVLGKQVGISLHENVVSSKAEKPPALPRGRQRKPLPPAVRHLEQPTYSQGCNGSVL